MSDGTYQIGMNIGQFSVDGCLIAGDRLLIVKEPVGDSDGLWEAIHACLNAIAERRGLGIRELLKKTVTFSFSSCIVEHIVKGKRGPRLGVIVTKGFEDSLYKRTGEAEPKGNILPEELIVGIDEKTDASGCVVKVVDKKDIYLSAKFLMERGAQTIAICLRNAYYNPSNEKEIMTVIDEEISRHYLGGVTTLCSHEVSATIDDHDRLNTTTLNLYAHRGIAQSVKEVAAKLRESDLTVPLRGVSSGLGGKKMVTRSKAIDLRSGEEIGALLAGVFLQDYVDGNRGNVVIVNMKGSSTFINVIEHGQYEYDLKPTICGMRVDLAAPKTNEIPVGIASSFIVDERGQLQLTGRNGEGSRVPACFDQGDVDPTLLDASLILGFIEPIRSVFGNRKLSRDAAVRAIKNKIADKMRITIEEAARRMKQTADTMIGDAVCQILVSGGLKPSEFDIYAVGDCGGIGGCGYGERIGARRIVVFPMSSAFSAFGAAVGDIVYEYRKPFVGGLCDERGNATMEGVQALEEAVGALRQEAFRDFREERIPKEDVKLSLRMIVVDAEKSESLVAVDKLGGEKNLEKVSEALAQKDIGHRVVGILLEGVSPRDKAAYVATKPLVEESTPAAKGKRKVYWEEQYVDTDVYDYDMLKTGETIEGPAVVDSQGGVFEIPQGYKMTLDRHRIGTVEKVP